MSMVLIKSNKRKENNNMFTKFCIAYFNKTAVHFFIKQKQYFTYIILIIMHL